MRRSLAGLLLLTLLLPTCLVARGTCYHRPLFRRHLYQSDDFYFTIEYDKADKESVTDLQGNIALAATLARSLREQRLELAKDYPIPKGLLAGGMQVRYDAYLNNRRILPIIENISVYDDPRDIARIGADEWARRLTRKQLVQISLYRRMKKRTRAIKRFFARGKFPNWLPLGLAAIESEPWTPEKMAVLLDGVKNNSLINLTQYTYLKSFTTIEKYRSIQESQAFCQWLIELVGKKRVISLMEAYTAKPTSFWSSFRKITGMTGSEAHQLFLTDMLKYLALDLNTPTEPDLVFSEHGQLSKPIPDPSGRLLAFTSNHLRPHSEQRDLFLCKPDGSRVTFAVRDVLESMAWHQPSEGLFFLRNVHTYGGKRFSQLCWAPCTRPLGGTVVRGGLGFEVVLRGTRFSEVALSPDNKLLALLSQRPSGGELKLYKIDSARGRPKLSFWKSLKINGVDMTWVDEQSLVYVRSARGTSQLVKLIVEKEDKEVLKSLNCTVYDLSSDGQGNILFSVPWSEDRGISLRSLNVKRKSDNAITLCVIPRSCFRFSAFEAGRQIYYIDYEEGRYRILRRGIPLRPRHNVARLSTKEKKETDFVLPATTIDEANENFKTRQLKPKWLKLRTKLIFEDDIQSVAGVWRDVMHQKKAEMALWYDRDFERMNWQVRYSKDSHHPGWFVGLFDTTKDDILRLFPLSRFTNDAFFRGGSLGLTHILTAREVLSFAFEFKENEYLPEFFGTNPVPTDLTASNHLYRIRYRWDLREDSADSEVNPFGHRLVELSWADSPTFLDSQLRYKEAILDWREYLNTGKNDRDVIAIRLLGGFRKKKGDSPYPVQFSLGGDDTLRGIRDGALEGTRFAALNLEYRKRLFTRQEAEEKVGLLRDPLLRPLFFFNTVYLAFFADAGAATPNSFNLDNIESGYGLELRAQSHLTKWRPLVLRIGFAHGTGALGEDRFYLSTGTVF